MNKAGQRPALLCSETSDVSVQAAFMTGRLVVMDQSLACGAIDDRYGSSIGLSGGVTVTGLDGRNDLFNTSTQPGPLTGIELTVFFRLPGALGCLC